MTDPTRWLIEQGRALLDSQGLRPAAQWDMNQLPTRRLETWQTNLLRQQLELRWRSRHRFPLPEQWLWTERSLAQASDYWSAYYKATLFPALVKVVDACCGAGADLVALARRGEVWGIDADPDMAALAQDNARVQGYPVPVSSERLVSGWRVEADWLSIDPDRRTLGRRTLEADEFSPSLEDILEMAEQVSGAIIKLAPATRYQADTLSKIESMAQRVWLGNLGECRQQLLLTGDLRRGTQPVAVLCEPSTKVREAPAGGAAQEPKPGLSREPKVAPPGVLEYSAASSQAALSAFDSPSSRRMERYVFDLHPVLHASGLQAAWAGEHGLVDLGDPHGFFTGNALPDLRWAQAFEVLAVLPWDDRQLRKWLRHHQCGTVEVKTRGLPSNSRQPTKPIDANACQRRYSSAEGEPVSLLVTRWEGRVRGIATRRVTGEHLSGEPHDYRD